MRPELVIQESGRCRAHPIAGGHPLCLGDPEHRQGTPGASGASALCCTRLSIALLLLPFPSSLLGFAPVLLPPRAHYLLAPPAVCGTAPGRGLAPPAVGHPQPNEGSGGGKGTTLQSL